jgi:hypothetical protein
MKRIDVLMLVLIFFVGMIGGMLFRKLSQRPAPPIVIINRVQIPEESSK